MKEPTAVKVVKDVIRKTKSRVKIPPAVKIESTQDLTAKIQETAYFLYVQRGCQNGNHREDWLEAERIVKGE